MGLSFYRKYLEVKAGDVDNSIIGILVNWDPKGMSKVDLAQREQWLDQIGKELITARRKFDRESAALAPRVQQNLVHIAAAEDLQKQVEAATDDGVRKGKEASLLTLLGVIEAEQPAIEQDKADAADTKSWLDERESAHKEAVLSLSTAKRDLDRAQQDLARAGQRRDREQEKTAQSRVTAGLAVDGTKLNKAVNAMKAATEKANQEADEARLKRQSLAPAPAPTADANIAAAIAKASGASEAPKSTADRLAALKAKAA